MRKLKQIVLFIFLVSLGTISFAQPANYAWIADFDDNFSNTRTFSDGVSGATIRSLTIQATDNSSEYLIEWDSFSNKWQNTSTPLNSVFTLFHGDGDSPNGKITDGVSVGKHYTFQIDGLDYSDRDAVVMETDNAPQSFHATASTAVTTPTSVFPGQSATININLAGNKSSQEKVFIRYTTDNWVSSAVVEATGTGTTWSTASATIPENVNAPGVEVEYYAYTTTVSATDNSNHDLITLRLGNDGGNNYSYTVQNGWTTASDGNWNTESTWTANAVPSVSEELGEVNIKHDVTLNQDATISSLTIDADKELNGGSATLTISSGGTLTNNGTFNANDGKVVFDGAGTVTGTVAFNDVDISGNVDFGDNSTINGDLRVLPNGFANTTDVSFGDESTLIFETGGDYVVGELWPTGPVNAINNLIIADTDLNFGSDGDARYLNGNLTINSSGELKLSDGFGGDLFIQGNWTNNGTFNANDRAVFFNGTAIQEINGTANTNFDFVFIEPQSRVTVAETTTIEVSENLTIKSDENSTGSLIHQTDNVQATVERYIEAAPNWPENDKEEDDGRRGWHFLSAPVTGMTIIGSDFVPSDDPLPNDFDFYAFDESAELPWINIRGENGTPNNDAFDDFVPGKGYLVAYQNTVANEFIGALNSGDVSIDLANSEANSDKNDWHGMNLLGNPYPSAIDWTEADHGSFVNTFAYIFDRNAGNGGDYVIIDGDPNGEPEYSTIIPAHQGFFVLANDNPGDFTFTNAMRVHGDDFMKDQPISEHIRLRITKDDFYSDTRIRIHKDAQHGTDRYDAHKLFSLNPNMPQVFSHTEDHTRVAINSIPHINEEQPITLGIRIPEDGEYTLSLQGVSGAFESSTLLLEDAHKDILHDLHAQPVYAFEAEEGMIAARFTLHFSPPDDDTTDIPGSDAPEARIWHHDNTLFVDNPGEQAELRLYDLSGRLMQTIQANTGQQSHELNLPAGAYIIQSNHQDIKPIKIIIH